MKSRFSLWVGGESPPSVEESKRLRVSFTGDGKACECEGPFIMTRVGEPYRGRVKRWDIREELSCCCLESKGASSDGLGTNHSKEPPW